MSVTVSVGGPQVCHRGSDWPK